MKQLWSPKWKSSRQPRKQRKFRINAPLHVRHRFVSTHLSPDLRRETGRRSFPIRKGDEVEIMVGSKKGLRGTVERVDLKKCRVFIDGIKVKKADGSEVTRPLNPTNLKIIKFNLDDKRRRMSLERPKGIGKQKTKTEKVKTKTEGAEKPEKKM